MWHPGEGQQEELVCLMEINFHLRPFPLSYFLSKQKAKSSQFYTGKHLDEVSVLIGFIDLNKQIAKGLPQ